LRAALERNPAARVSQQRARAMRAAAKAEGDLPPPEVMGQVWQVPLSDPAALNTQMIMVGLTQNFPAPGTLSAREHSMEAQADQEDAMGSDRARMIVREAGHAFADYQESSARQRIHRAHHQITRHLLDVAAARHSAGGALTDVTRAEVEVSRLEADVVKDATLVDSARAHINALLARPPGESLGAPAETEPMVPFWDVATLVAKARSLRPELKQAQAEREAKEYAATAAEREATWPSFSLGALYFPPTKAMPLHSYGATLSMSLPWFWGAAGDKKNAERESLLAARLNAEAARIPVDSDVVTSEANARSAAYRLQVLRERTLPAAQRSLEAARTGFESGRTDLMTILDASRSAVDIEEEIVMARSSLEHALTDLEAAVGTEIPLRALGPFNPDQLNGGGQ
jgi:outer membrane protein TolC